MLHWPLHVGHADVYVCEYAYDKESNAFADVGDLRSGLQANYSDDVEFYVATNVVKPERTVREGKEAAENKGPV